MTSVSRERTARSREIRIEGRRMVVTAMKIAPSGVRLPDLDESVSQWAAVVVPHLTSDNDALAEGLAFVPRREIVLAFGDGIVPVNRAGALGKCVWKINQR